MHKLFPRISLMNNFFNFFFVIFNKLITKKKDRNAYNFLFPFKLCYKADLCVYTIYLIVDNCNRVEHRQVLFSFRWNCNVSTYQQNEY